MRRAGVLALVVALAAAARLLPPGPAARQLGPGMALGVLLLGGYLAGTLVARLKLPQLTGYLLFGLAAGPAVGHLLEGPLLDALRPVDGMAVALIAMSAGAELRFGWLRRHAARVAVVGGLLGLGVTALVTGALLLARARVPFLAGLDGEAAVLAALLVGITMASTSPLVILAVTAETQARGPVTDLLLGVAVLMDLVVVVAVGVVLAVARSRLGGEAVGAGEVALALGLHLGGSLALGAVLGGALVLWLRRVGRELALVVAGVCLAISEVGTRMHLEPLLVAIAAGMVLINFGGPRSGRFVRAIERVSLPVYALFFGLVGAHLDPKLLVSLGVVGAGLVALRGLALFGATWAGARLTGTEVPVRRVAWLGFVSQAGVTLGIAVTIAHTFPGWGEAVAGLVIGVVAVNTLVGPVLHRLALVRAGEVHAAPGGKATP